MKHSTITILVPDNIPVASLDTSFGRSGSLAWQCIRWPPVRRSPPRATGASSTSARNATRQPGSARPASSPSAPCTDGGRHEPPTSHH